MYCLRCGRDTKSDRVFCDQCHENMEEYPVKPDTPIHLPKRVPKEIPKKKGRRLTPEEQVLQLKKALRRTRGFIAALIVLLALSLGALYYFAVYLEDSNLGKNYIVAGQQETE